MPGEPKKYTKVNGIMKLNPEYKKWKNGQNQAAAGPMVPASAVAPATTVITSNEALPIVASMDDYEKLNDSIGAVPLAESTNATIEMIQEPDIAAEVGLESDDMVDKLGNLLTKYEIPIGLTNKLMLLSEYQSLEFIIDDSGSMTLNTDSNDPVTHQPLTRWAEAQMRLKEMLEVVAHVPFQQVGIEFLNRKDRITFKRNGMAPADLVQHMNREVDAVFRQGPRGTTPALEKFQESLMRGKGVKISRYFFGDGVPNGGQPAIKKIVELLVHRPDPESCPVTFISCTNDDEAVEWMKDAEEIAPYCSESDDFNDEAREVMRDQGVALPFSKGFHLICQLVAVMCPDDLDAMDESIPFTKFTLDNTLGIVNNEASYKHYFDKFVEAQQNRRVEIDRSTGMPSKLDELRKNTRWHYSTFLTTNGPAKLIQQASEYQRQILQSANVR